MMFEITLRYKDIEWFGQPPIWLDLTDKNATDGRFDPYHSKWTKTLTKFQTTLNWLSYNLDNIKMKERYGNDWRMNMVDPNNERNEDW